VQVVWMVQALRYVLDREKKLIWANN